MSDKLYETECFVKKVGVFPHGTLQGLEFETSREYSKELRDERYFVLVESPKGGSKDILSTLFLKDFSHVKMPKGTVVTMIDLVLAKINKARVRVTVSETIGKDEKSSSKKSPVLTLRKIELV